MCFHVYFFTLESPVALIECARRPVVTSLILLSGLSNVLGYFIHIDTITHNDLLLSPHSSMLFWNLFMTSDIPVTLRPKPIICLAHRHADDRKRGSKPSFLYLLHHGVVTSLVVYIPHLFEGVCIASGSNVFTSHALKRMKTTCKVHYTRADPTQYLHEALTSVTDNLCESE